MNLHYTKENMAIDLLKLVPYQYDDILLDPCSGLNKVFYNNFKSKIKLECEIEEGKDFFDWEYPVDWVISNPPYHKSWKFTEHALNLADKGIAWLINNQALNSHLTPRRLDLYKEKGFSVAKIHVVADARWFGRYYFLVLEKNKPSILTWERKTY